MEELNHRGKKFVDDWCNETHSTTGRIPNQHYLLEEKVTLLELPKTHYHMDALKTRKVSPDSFVSIEGNKYSVPVTYVDRNVFYRIIYGFRIEIYDKNEQLILRQEAFDSKRNVLTNDEHYAPIAPKVNTSIPQIRRDFTERFRNGSRYLEAAGHRFDQPTHHARRILELQELYDDNVLDYFIGVAIDEDMMDITSFRSLLRDYNNGYRTLFEEPRDYASSKNELIRDCSYYEQSTKEVAP